MRRLLFSLTLAVVAGAAEAIAPYARFDEGLIGRIRPNGWIGEFCRRQKTGLTGHPEALSYPYDTCLWAGVIPRMGKHGGDWWRYEQTAYYVDGLLRLGYALGDQELIAKGESSVAYTIEHASPDGHFGAPSTTKAADGLDMWPQAVFFRVLAANYAVTGDARIPAMLERYYLKHSVEKIAGWRNVINVEGMLWTYAITGNKELLDRAEKAWLLEKTQLTASEMRQDLHPTCMHGVTYSETLKVPMMLYAATGKKEHLDTALKAMEKLIRDHMLPDGVHSSIEQTRGNNAAWGHETCNVSDLTWSLGYFLTATGEGRWADMIERAVFNAGPGSVTKEFDALQYFSNPNQFIATADSDNNPYKRGSTWMAYRPTHETECCAGNVHRFMPNYVARMWLKGRAKDEIVAALYGASRVAYPLEAGGELTVVEETDYPFSGRIRFTFDAPQPVARTFTFRVPNWCEAGAVAKVNGQDAGLVLKPGMFVSLARTFAKGDVVELDFPMAAHLVALPRRRTVVSQTFRYTDTRGLYVDGPDRPQGAYVLRGPVLYSYAIPFDKTEDTAVYENMNGKKSANPDFRCWRVKPTGAFNYALAGDSLEVRETGLKGYALDLATPPVTIAVKARKIRWELDEGGRYTPDMPDRVEAVSDQIETLELVPYGSTLLRLTVFPVL